MRAVMMDSDYADEAGFGTSVSRKYCCATSLTFAVLGVVCGVLLGHFLLRCPINNRARLPENATEVNAEHLRSLRSVNDDGRACEMSYRMRDLVLKHMDTESSGADVRSMLAGLVLLSSVLCDPVQGTNSRCSPFLRRYSVKPTLCLRPNTNCEIENRGLNATSRKLIIGLHNELRNTVAIGYLKSLPWASNMMQLEYDYELEAEAQALADQCSSESDCLRCRQVENYPVGQNNFVFTTFAMRTSSSPVEWERAFRKWIEGLNVFKLQSVRNYTFDEEYGSLALVLWGDVWRIGCGYIHYQADMHEYIQQYICNYGPAGNYQGKPVYKEGKPCSRCPSGTCCGDGCEAGNPNYSALCKSQTPNGPEEIAPKHSLVYCSFLNDTSLNCPLKISPEGSFEFRRILGGAYATSVLSGGNNASIVFGPFDNIPKSFCILLSYRKGPTLAEQQGNSSSAKLSISGYGNKKTSSYLFTQDTSSLWVSSVLMVNFHPAITNVTITVTFRVNTDSPDQYFDLNKLAVRPGNESCTTQ